jgi:hypothetical protein
MTGSASAPKTVNPGAHPDYVITQTDRDTNLQQQQVIDITCGIAAVAIRSMMPNTWTAVLRGVDGNGTYTWDVRGTAKNEVGEYHDE